MQMQCSFRDVRVPFLRHSDVTTKGHRRRGVCGRVELYLGRGLCGHVELCLCGRVELCLVSGLCGRVEHSQGSVCGHVRCLIGETVQQRAAGGEFD